ncbi:ABC transporter permease [Mycolicibacterium madagascariense]|uniref:ABC transporter permease n=1 Tax=Mycolicibacterium madagascariense TaxID=212765 RepID=A0A7I7XC12_9MYCO|nr:ABC transporter permease [Mycolicibacterium madagascariense]MCV7014753.1 ABC transporter permease subunit [Mycolicibacterium madagascariense]BBZ26463.1 ABC transporter permease [Mycolicibacterium madagascariense]
MRGLLNAERIKLTSTRSPRWSSAAVVVASLGLAAALGGAAGSESTGPTDAVLGVAVLGVPLFMVLAAISVTNEYRSGMIRTTFVATPGRWRVLIAKAVVLGAFSALFAAVLSCATVLVTWLWAGPGGLSWTLDDAEVWRTVAAMTTYGAASAVLGVGVGALLRHTAGAVALLLLWPLVVEPVVSALPHVGPTFGPYLPFRNVIVFVGALPTDGLPWGRAESLLYFLAVVTAVFCAGALVVDGRDA